MQTAAGTPLYAAPEVLDIYSKMVRGQQPEKPFHSSCDVWSAGWILFEMLFGCKPIEPQGLSEEQFFEKVRSLDFTWPPDGMMPCLTSPGFFFELHSCVSM
jgi:serine/threonine protein kinase